MQSEDHDMPLASLRSFMEDLENAIAVARTLVDAGHAIDLTGFDRLVGLLCAQVLDLSPDDARVMKDDLAALLVGVDALSFSLTEAGKGAAA